MSDLRVSDTRARTRKTRGAGTQLRALLAGGLVLGVGGIITLASWNDSEFVNGTFASGVFSIEGSTNSTTWAEHPSAGSAASLSFTVNPTNLSPNDVVYAPFAVRLAANTTADATVTLANGGTTGTLTGLTYKLIKPATWGCDSSTTGTTIVPAGTALTGTPTVTPFALTKGSGSSPGSPAYLCFVVTASSGLAQGISGTITWDLAATSG